MKKVTAGMFVTLAAVALAAPFFAVAVFVGLRAVEEAVGLRGSFLLPLLALAAVASGVLGARGDATPSTARAVVVRRRETRKASALHLGW